MFFRKENQPCPLELLAWRNSLPAPHCPHDWRLLGRSVSPGSPLVEQVALKGHHWGGRKLGAVLLAGPIESPSTGGGGES